MPYFLIDNQESFQYIWDSIKVVVIKGIIPSNIIIQVFYKKCTHMPYICDEILVRILCNITDYLATIMKEY